MTHPIATRKNTLLCQAAAAASFVNMHSDGVSARNVKLYLGVSKTHSCRILAAAVNARLIDRTATCGAGLLFVPMGRKDAVLKERGIEAKFKKAEANALYNYKRRSNNIHDLLDFNDGFDEVVHRHIDCYSSTPPLPFMVSAPRSVFNLAKFL